MAHSKGDDDADDDDIGDIHDVDGAHVDDDDGDDDDGDEECRIPVLLQLRPPVLTPAVLTRALLFGSPSARPAAATPARQQGRSSRPTAVKSTWPIV